MTLIFFFVVQGSLIAFTAKISKDVLHLHAGSTVIFDDLETNYGDGYDQNTGIFTCPDDGLYIFHVTFLTYFGNNFIGFLVKNGHDVVAIDANAHDMNVPGYQSASNMAAIPLIRGEMVWVQTHTEQGEHLLKGFATFVGVKICKHLLISLKDKTGFKYE